MFYREVWIAGEGRNRACLHTKDRNEAERLGRLLLAELLKQETARIPGKVTLGELWGRYQLDSPAYMDNASKTKRDAESRARTLIGFFGESCDVRTLSEKDQAAYVKQRAAGGIVRSDGEVTQPVRVRSAQADLVLLQSMLTWATTVRINGTRWLDQNPLTGIKMVREKNPLRPVASWERFQRTRVAMQELAAFPSEDVVRWTKLELALVLAEATGRRLNSIRELAWDDIDFAAGTIRWRAEADKKGKEWVIPMPPKLAEELKQFQRRLSAVGGLVFSSEKSAERPMDRHLFDKWLTVAEREAGLPKLKGGLWHPYRRKWATERKHLSLKDVAAAGGWKDTETLLTCYQQPDADTLLKVMSEEHKVREAALG